MFARNFDRFIFAIKLLQTFLRDWQGVDLLQFGVDVFSKYILCDLFIYSFIHFIVHPVTHVTPDTSDSLHTTYISSSTNL
jgi:hypothetical protein